MKQLELAKRLLENREYIELAEAMEYPAKTYLPIDGFNSGFVLDYGICTNIDLWSVELVDIGDGLADFMDYAGAKFCAIHSLPFHCDAIYPVPHDDEFGPTGKWKNPSRWKYLEFVIDELEYLIEFGNGTHVKGIKSLTPEQRSHYEQLT